MYDLIIKNGRVIDPARGTDGVETLYIRGGVLEKLVVGDNGETFLSNLEAAGFYDQFVGKEVSSLDVMGADLVSGATKSSTAVRNGVNAAVEYYIEHASGGEA